MDPTRRCALLALCLGSLLASPGALADPLDPESRFSFGGFGTVGLAHNSTAGAEFIRDILQPRGVADGWSANVDSLLGLQATFRPTRAIESTVQAVSLYNDEGSYQPRLTWAFVSYSPDPEFSARAGRLGWDVYMLSDSRNVGYSYLWVRPPVDYFGPLQIAHLDGADATFRRNLGGGLASAKLYAGRVRQKIPTPGASEFDISGSTVAGGAVDYRRGDWFLRLGYSRVDLGGEFPDLVPLLSALRGIGTPQSAALASDLAFDGKIIRNLNLGVAWEHASWQAQLSYDRRDSGALALRRTDSAYFLLGRRIGEWTGFATVAGAWSPASRASTGLPTPNPLDGAISAILAGTRSDQRTLSLGARYDFARNFDLKLQVDRVHVLHDATFLWRNPRAGWNGRATVVSVALDFAF